MPLSEEKIVEINNFGNSSLSEFNSGSGHNNI